MGLAGLTESAGLAKDATKKNLRRARPAGQFGNWIQQDAGDPFILIARNNFAPYELVDDEGKVLAFSRSSRSTRRH